MQHYCYFMVHKPFGVLSQFTKEIPEHQTLADLYDFPPQVYPVGRLDKDSEGLLILTNDKSLTDRLLNPKHQHWRTYWVQVEGQIDEDACQKLASGVTIQINKKDYQTLPAQVKPLTKAKFPDRIPPIRFRANIPTSWLEIKLIEGKNRQVRKMCARVGFPVLRLVRVAIVGLKLDDLPIGDVKKLTQKEIYDKLS